MTVLESLRFYFRKSSYIYVFAKNIHTFSEKAFDGQVRNLFFERKTKKASGNARALFCVLRKGDSDTVIIELNRDGANFKIRSVDTLDCEKTNVEAVLHFCV
uniref:Uncharacterized protein n=1 Tax=Photinus pyralis TaxID=7054 RepID=A0A1Y1KW37_PHOPY